MLVQREGVWTAWEPAEQRLGHCYMLSPFLLLRCRSALPLPTRFCLLAHLGGHQSTIATHLSADPWLL